MRIVLDTNVLLVSSSSKSPYHWIFSILLSNRFDLIVSTEILAEYSEILEKHMGRIVSENILSLIENLENLVKDTPSFRFNLILADYDDNKFVDCAIASNADFIVKENRHFEGLKKINFPKVEIKSISQFKLILESKSGKSLLRLTIFSFNK
jgi:putative PIN family toxin of toxin-antitoxin system